MSLNGVELLEEKSLLDIYVKSIRRLPPSPFNIISTFLFFLLLVCDTAYFPNNYSNRIEQTRSLAELGLSFGSTILGFLIAGFTIFSTLSKPELFKKMNDTPHVASGLSYLKVNFFVFVEVFAVYTFFLIFCLSVKLLCGPRALFPSLMLLSEANPINGFFLSRQWFINVGFVTLGTTAFYSLIALKSFIFNTYHSVVTSVLWAFNPAETAKAEMRRDNFKARRFKKLPINIRPNT